MLCMQPDAKNATSCSEVRGTWDEQHSVCLDPALTQWSQPAEGCSPGFVISTCSQLSETECAAQDNAVYNGAAGLLTCAMQDVACANKDVCEARGVCDTSLDSVAWMLTDETCRVPMYGFDVTANHEKCQYMAQPHTTMS